MSEQPAETEATSEEAPPVGLYAQGDVPFGALMDALAPDEDDPEAGEGKPAAGSDADAGGQTAPADQATPDGGAAADPKATGAPGEPGVQDAAGATEAGDTTAPVGDGGDRPAEWTTPAAELIPRFGELSTKLEETTARAYHEEALEAVREEHKPYFEALEKHPRLLVGTDVPRTDGQEGMETLRDEADVRSWQEAVKSILVAEVRDRASRSLEDNSEFLSTMHASIELFQNNADLIPGTKDFDVQLANEFAELMKPYELRVEDKLQGYSIPVQPIINKLRSDLVAKRAAKPEAPAAPEGASSTAPPGPGQQAATEDPPQAGLASKAGNSSDDEDFSTLFGTLGLPNMRI